MQDVYGNCPPLGGTIILEDLAILELDSIPTILNAGTRDWVGTAFDVDANAKLTAYINNLLDIALPEKFAGSLDEKVSTIPPENDLRSNRHPRAIRYLEQTTSSEGGTLEEFSKWKALGDPNKRSDSATDSTTDFKLRYLFLSCKPRAA
jgi:hypothetical protein